MSKVQTACVIDDDDIYTFMVKRLMALAGFAEKTLFFHNGQAALNYMTEHVHQPEMLPDVILLDINMPVMDGWQFMAAFEKLLPLITKKIDIFIVSSSVDEDDINKAKSIEAISDFIVKPVTVARFEEILQKINRVKV